MNKDTSWQPLLSMVLNLADGYADLLIIEGIYILKMMSKTLQHRRNCKLQIFVNSEWFSWFKKSNNKIHDIMLYDKWYKNMMAKNNFPNNRGVINKKSIISHREINGFKYYKKFWLIIGVDDYNPPFSKLNNAINYCMCGFSLTTAVYLAPRVPSAAKTSCNSADSCSQPFSIEASASPIPRLGALSHLVDR